MGQTDGPIAVARFVYPTGISIAPNGNIYVVESLNSTIRKIGPGYTIGGAVSGLNGALILQNSNGDTKTIKADGSFTLDMPVIESGSYAVTVQTQPAGQSCTITGGSGTATAYVTDISVSCSGNSATAYTIGGTVSGLTGTLELLNSNGDKTPGLTSNGAFSFTASMAQGAAYAVSVSQQPTGQTCTVSNGSGTATATVSNVSVSCVTSTYTIGGKVSGLTGTLVLQNNGVNNLSLTVNGNFTFPTPVAYKGAYAVTVLTQPAGQACTITDSLRGTTSGTATANVSTITVSCKSIVSTATTVAGSGTAGSTDGTGVAASFDSPFGITSDSAGNLYVTDSFGLTVRKLTPAGVVSTIAGTAGVFGAADGTGSAASFNSPEGIAVDTAGNLYVADASNNTIRKITQPAGVVTTLAGTAGPFGNADGTGAAARFKQPGGVAVDSSGNLFVVDSGNHTIRKITPAGVVSTIAGTGAAGSANGTGTAASFNGPNGIAIDATGNLFVADTGNHTIRKITPAGVVTTVAGSVGVSGSTDATGTAAKFNTPFGITVNSAGILFVADTYNNTIRKIDTAGVVTTISGTAGVCGSTNASGTAASFCSPTHITVDPAGNLFVTDLANNLIRKVTP